MKTSIGRKFLMALSGLFLLIFLLQHFIINFLSVISPNTFNEVSQFFGTNGIIQFVMQPILVFAVIFHLFMGVKLEIQNNAARPIKYAYSNAGANSSWMSRNMIITGIMVLLFLALHLYDFFFPEMNIKYVQGDMTGMINGEYRFYPELVHKFSDTVRVAIYCLSFVFLSLHLLHGFQSAFQSVGFNHRKYTPIIKKISNIYAIVIPAGFIFIALFHYFVSQNNL
jgi:succinate dehydrogenase / fumarate reductase cytochrome b subunit